MSKLSIRLGVAALATVAIVYGCGDHSNSPAGPESTRSTAFRQQVECGEVGYVAALPPVLLIWEDSIETWLGDGLLDEPPVWTGASTVGDHLGALVPVLQQWETAINGNLGSAVLDSVADFDPPTTHQQDYLVGLSSLLVSWKGALETNRGLTFLPDPPVFQPDETPPMISCIADTTITCADSLGVVFEFDVTAIDDCDPSPVVTCEPPSGSTFPLGTTVVTCTAVDSSGNASTCTFSVTLEEAAPPVIVGASASPGRLWPPNHKWVNVHVSVDVEDECDASPSCTILGVTSNEPINGIGDGNTEPDWMITGDTTLKLRAERSGTGGGRIYYVQVRCENDSGNGAETTVEVIVPHDQGGK